MVPEALACISALQRSFGQTAKKRYTLSNFIHDVYSLSHLHRYWLIVCESQFGLCSQLCVVNMIFVIRLLAKWISLLCSLIHLMSDLLTVVAECQYKMTVNTQTEGAKRLFISDFHRAFHHVTNIHVLYSCSSSRLQCKVAELVDWRYPHEDDSKLQLKLSAKTTNS